jgi:hypothetical protein
MHRGHNGPPFEARCSLCIRSAQESDFDHFAVDLDHKLIRTNRDLKAATQFFTAGLANPVRCGQDDSAVRVYNGHTYELTGHIEVDADSMAYDPGTRYMS